ncbi:MAG: sugar transferase [Clostridia bacterium]|nr:sugar transferase [Clostridia bacterium]
MNTKSAEDVQALHDELVRDYLKSKRIYWNFKRTFDIIASLSALIVLGIPMLIVALLIYIDDPHGSPFFSQDRVGRDGKVFKFYKFRSMVVNAEDLLDDLQEQNEKTGPVFKMKDDPRITKIGKFIRKTSIDELPQLVNILKGDMSVVGPRPALPKEVEQYDDYARLRLLITPGLTCYWQVQDNRDDITFEEWMDMDIKYIKERTFWGDIKLIFKTVKVAITGQGT